MLYIVDGTGEADDKEYAKSMAGGLCKELQKLGLGRYYRGPSVDGRQTFDIAKLVLKDLLDERKRSHRDDIFLAGHSRGGAAVVWIAKQLNQMGVAVKAMFLFDAVDRTLQFSDLDVVPGNVGACYHARRDRSLAGYYETGVKRAFNDWLDCIDANPGKPAPCAKLALTHRQLVDQDIKMKRAMRCSTLVGFGVPDGGSIDFGNCATSAESPCSYQEKFFLGSHGAIGGAPIIDKTAPNLLIASDRAAIASVRVWMQGAMKAEGVFAAQPSGGRSTVPFTSTLTPKPAPRASTAR